MAPVLQEDKLWFHPIDNFQLRESPSVNIDHNNSSNHCVCPFQFENADYVYLLDSNLGKIMKDV